MKCIEKHGEIRRVSDSDARIFVEKRGWVYCPKWKWKDARKNKS